MKINIRVKMRKDLDVLILDSNQILRKNIVNIIKTMGFRGKVYEAGTLESADKFIEENNIDYIIFDWNIPNIEGENYLKQLRDNKKFKNAPIMLLTEEDDVSKMLKALENGASNYVVKPVQVETFIERFQTAYEKHYKDGVKK